MVSALLWALLYLLTLSRLNLCRDNRLGWYPDSLKTLFTHNINKTCDSHALILLSLCYLPGKVFTTRILCYKSSVKDSA